MATAPRVVDHYDSSGRNRRLILRFDESASIPTFEQLRAQLSVMVATGLLEPGDRLPAARDMAQQTGLAPGTVALACRELEQSGVVATAGRRGTFVADDPPVSEPLEERRRRMRELAERFAFEVRQLGVRPADALRAAEEALAQPDR